MSYWIITVSGVVIFCTNVDRLTNMEQKTDEWKERMDEYTSKLNEKLDIKDATVQLGHELNDWNQLSLNYIEDKEFIEEFQRVIDDKSLPHTTDDNIDNIAKRDTYLNMELGLPRGDDDHITHATVKKES